MHNTDLILATNRAHAQQSMHCIFAIIIIIKCALKLAIVLICSWLDNFKDEQ